MSSPARVRLAAALAELGERDRRLLALSRLDRLTPAEMATVLRVTPAAVARDLRLAELRLARRADAIRRSVLGTTGPRKAPTRALPGREEKQRWRA
jgi:DNA-directed RNA polymerase specialized sigma24 family protein